MEWNTGKPPSLLPPSLLVERGNTFTSKTKSALCRHHFTVCYQRVVRWLTLSKQSGTKCEVSSHTLWYFSNRPFVFWKVDQDVDIRERFYRFHKLAWHHETRFGWRFLNGWLQLSWSSLRALSPLSREARLWHTIVNMLCWMMSPDVVFTEHGNIYCRPLKRGVQSQGFTHRHPCSCLCLHSC